jgi:hypothetical protein
MDLDYSPVCAVIKRFVNLIRITSTASGATTIASALTVDHDITDLY